jgi:hypothetical protein
LLDEFRHAAAIHCRYLTRAREKIAVLAPLIAKWAAQIAAFGGNELHYCG